ncbi:MAG: hypothetical protein FWF84_05705, partial [Kiritimatiellaeota bacterium]|nr:hypothetical protein [Kiritimatiellota bacterium]
MAARLKEDRKSKRTVAINTSDVAKKALRAGLSCILAFILASELLLCPPPAYAAETAGGQAQA